MLQNQNTKSSRNVLKGRWEVTSSSTRDVAKWKSSCRMAWAIVGCSVILMFSSTCRSWFIPRTPNLNLFLIRKRKKSLTRSRKYQGGQMVRGFYQSRLPVICASVIRINMPCRGCCLLVRTTGFVSRAFSSLSLSKSLASHSLPRHALVLLFT